MRSRKQRTWEHPAPRPTVDELLAARNRTNRVRTDFLTIDLQMALTFVQIARDTNDDSRRQRNCAAARKAYTTMSHLVDTVELSAEDSAMVRRGLEYLKAELQALGETF